MKLNDFIIIFISLGLAYFVFLLLTEWIADLRFYRANGWDFSIVRPSKITVYGAAGPGPGPRGGAISQRSRVLFSLPLMLIATSGALVLCILITLGIVSTHHP